MAVRPYSDPEHADHEQFLVEQARRGHNMDVRIHDQGTMIGFVPLTAAAQEWFATNVPAEDWQWLNHVLWVDHRFASDLIKGLEEANFIVERL